MAVGARLAVPRQARVGSDGRAGLEVQGVEGGAEDGELPQARRCAEPGSLSAERKIQVGGGADYRHAGDS
eukprot:766557-Hanusia_phi.AAC.4